VDSSRALMIISDHSPLFDPTSIIFHHSERKGINARVAARSFVLIDISVVELIIVRQ
jgi:hypothetical protein